MSGQSPIIPEEPHPAFSCTKTAPPRQRGGVGGGVLLLWLIRRTSYNIMSGRILLMAAEGC